MRKILRYLKEILYLEPAFVLRYYRQRKIGVQPSIHYVMMADGRMYHGGLFDRLKGAVSIYALAKATHRNFGIYFVAPFQLENYLVPNIYDWRVNNNKLIYSFPASRPIIAYGDYRKSERLLRMRNGQVHYYFGSDIVKGINQEYSKTYDWSTLYNELFKPSDELALLINKERELIGAPYIAVHLRFLNLLGDKNENHMKEELSMTEKECLINKCFYKIEELKKRHTPNKLRTIVMSDSMLFLKELHHCMPDVYIVKGNVLHIDNVNHTSHEDNMKLFLDMYLISEAKKVYSIISGKMYSSDFPVYASKISKVPFERVYVS